ncbi:MAG TPA: hypothetical protein VJ501_07185 [Burkholderiaceae bacterium]|nr:hypothetical protein [Burkholderiaceae bacterium]
MKCTKSLVYAGKRYQVGDEFEVTSKQDAKILAAIRKAVRAPDVVPAWQPVAEEARKKRTYTRRDLVAEEPRVVLPVPVVEVSEPVKE